mmetsp:Transcript_28701/g.43337  ORF Transcript_28701/g.43337 Transcript_28701/m.43337 type:complete len:245 (+) Transcript_28701:1476-2210(+)
MLLVLISESLCVKAGFIFGHLPLSLDFGLLLFHFLLSHPLGLLVLEPLEPEFLLLLLSQPLKTELLSLLLSDLELSLSLSLLHGLSSALLLVLVVDLLLGLEVSVEIDALLGDQDIGEAEVVVLLDELVQLGQVVPVLMLQEQGQVHEQQGGRSAHTSGAMQVNMMALHFNHIMQVLTRLEQLLDVLLLFDVADRVVHNEVDPAGLVVSQHALHPDSSLAVVGRRLDVEYGRNAHIVHSLHVHV